MLIDNGELIYSPPYLTGDVLSIRYLYIKILIFLERTFKSIAMDTDFLIDIVYHSVIGYVR